jgi:hypothetical protein
MYGFIQDFVLYDGINGLYQNPFTPTQPFKKLDGSILPDDATNREVVVIEDATNQVISSTLETGDFSIPLIGSQLTTATIICKDNAKGALVEMGVAYGDYV